MGIPDQYIVSCVRKGELYYTPHALEQMANRKISTDDVCEAILNGLPIEQQDHGRDIKIVFQPRPKGGIPKFYVVVAAAYKQAVVVTVCLTRKEVWEFLGNFTLKRKKRKGR